MPRAKHEQNIEQVAKCIFRIFAYDIDGHLAMEPRWWAKEAAIINADTGWSFDVNYDSHEYIDPMNNWTRVEGLKLSDHDLATAYTLTLRWLN